MTEEKNDLRLNRILVVDDTSANLQLLTNLLTAHGYTVYPASDGEMALEFLKSTLPDLILLDIRMPGIDGFEVCRRLKADDRTSSIPVIFISILEDEHDKIKGFQAGAVDFVTKPFQAEEVLARVKIHLDLRKLTEHLEQKVVERTEELHTANTELQHELAERKQAEEALRRSEEKYRTIFENVNEGFALHKIITDESGVPIDYTFLDINPAFEAMTGLHRDKVIGKTAREVLPGIEKDPADWIGRYGKVALTGEGINFENYSEHIGKWYQVNAFSPRAGYFAVTFTDTTVQKRVEQERHAHLWFFESMDEINRAIQGTNDLGQMMSVVLDAMLSIFDCDRAWLVYPCDPDAPSWQVPMERTKPEYPGANVLGLEVPMDAGIREAHRIQLASNDPVKYGPGGHPLPEEVSKQFGFKAFISIALHPKIGKPWQFGMHQCSYARQWTAQEERLLHEIGNRLEDALTSLLSHRNLQESEERYRLVFENSPVSIREEDFSSVNSFLNDLKKQGVTDIETYFDQKPEVVHRCAEMVKILDVNNALVTLHKAADKEELLAGLVNTFTPESFETFRQVLICLWNGETEMTSDTVIKPLEGEARNVTVCFSVCPGYEETLSKVFVSLIDITERKAAEEALRQLNKELDWRVLERTAKLEAANKELEGFSYSVSHDLRAPLRHIDGFLELLQKRAGTALNEQARHYIGNISDAAKKMGLLIDDLLAFSRMGRHAVTIQQVDLERLVRDILHEFEPDTTGRNIDWRIGDLPVVSGDKGMLRIVLVNLISNAVKFTRPRAQAKIEIGWLHPEKTETVFFVRDNGVGFDMAYSDKLFGVFQRLHRDDEFEGTGIGLANVRRIINRHGGRTWADGKVDQGAAFYFSLPHNIQEA